MSQQILTSDVPARNVRIAAIQMASVPANKADNLAIAAKLIADANADIAVLPELFATEFFASEKDARFFDYAETVDGALIGEIRQIARNTQTIIAAPFFEYDPSGRYFNSTALVGADGEVIGVYRKTHIPMTLTFEKYYFSPGSSIPVFDTPIGKVGILICYDRWYPEAWAALRDAGAEIVCVPIASWEYQGGSEAPWWNALHQIRAKENQLFIAASNRTGIEGEFSYIGRSLLVSPSGAILAEANGEDNVAIVSDIDLADVRRTRGRWPILRDRRPELFS